MNVLVDTRPFKFRRILTEAENSDGKFIVEGLMQVADDLNGNGRIYPKKVLEREFKNLRTPLLNKAILLES